MVFLFVPVWGQESEDLYSFDRSEIEAMNALSLADLMRKLPFVFTYFEGESQHAQLGAHSFDISAVYKDDMALFLDQNASCDLQSIDLNNVIKIVFKTINANSSCKNATGINIYMYTENVAGEKSSLVASASNTTNNDFTTQVYSTASNSKHSIGFGIGTVFQNGLKKDVYNRSFAWTAFNQYHANLTYKFQFYDKASIQLSYGLNILDIVKRGNIFEGTSRAADIQKNSNQSWLNLAAESKLSKTHTIAINGQISSKSLNRYTIEQDLSNHNTEILPITNPADSTNYLFTQFKTVFRKYDKSLNYSYHLGIEFTNLSDRNYDNIQALKVGYTDYCLNGGVQYSPVDKLQFDVGLQYLSNNLLGNYILPFGKIKLIANENLYAELRHQQSAVYPNLYQLFYNTPYQGLTIESNSELLSSVFRTTNFQAFLKVENVTLRSGMFFTTHVSYVDLNFSQNSWANKRESSDISTYAFFDLKTNGFQINPGFIIHGLSALADTVNRFYFVPEAVFKASYQNEKIGFGIFVFGKFVGDFSSMSETESQLLFTKIQGNKNLDISLHKSFFDSRLNFYIGLNNFFNVFEVNRSVFGVNPVEDDLLNVNQLPVNRGRNYYVKILYRSK